MTKQVFVLTEEYSHRLIGVYSHYGLAVNALFNNALGYTAVEVVPQLIGTAYNFKDINGNNVSFFIEDVDLDDDLYLGPAEIYKEEEEE